MGLASQYGANAAPTDPYTLLYNAGLLSPSTTYSGGQAPALLTGPQSSSLAGLLSTLYGAENTDAGLLNNGAAAQGAGTYNALPQVQAAQGDLYSAASALDKDLGVNAPNGQVAAQNLLSGPYASIFGNAQDASTSTFPTPTGNDFNPYFAAAVLAPEFLSVLGPLAAAGTAADAGAATGAAATGGGGFLSGLGSLGGDLSGLGSSISGGLSSLGGDLSGLGSSISGGLSSLFGSPVLGQIGTSALEGAGLGGAVTGLEGGNILKGAELGGLSGGAIGGVDAGFNALGGFSGIANDLGLGSFLGGSGSSASDLIGGVDALNGPSAGLNTAASAATPSTSILSGAAASPASGAGAVAGGSGASSLGESFGVPSASGTGGLDLSGLNNFNTGSVGSGALDLSPLNENLGAQSVGNGYGATTGGLFGTGNAATPSLSGSLEGTGGGLASGVSPTASGAFGSGIPTGSIPISGGSGMGVLGNLFGGGSGGAAGGSAGTSVLNGLLRTGITGLFNNPNNAGYNAQNLAGQQIQSDYQPFLNSGTAANNTLASLYGTQGGGAQAAAQANFAGTPGYQFALNQGEQAVNANAARTGQTLSGNNQQAVQNYGTGLANSTVQQYIANLQNQAAQGASAAGGVATGQAGIANAQAGKGAANANNQNAITSGIASSLFPQNGINFGAGGLNMTNSNNGLLSLLFGNSGGTTSL